MTELPDWLKISISDTEVNAKKMEKARVRRQKRNKIKAKKFEDTMRESLTGTITSGSGDSDQQDAESSDKKPT